VEPRTHNTFAIAYEQLVRWLHTTLPQHFGHPAQRYSSTSWGRMLPAVISEYPSK
jgi:hypothetical protein